MQAAADACVARPARYGDVLVRTKVPDLPWDVVELGGGWVFDHRTNTCRDGVDDPMSVIPTQPGYCGEVALASDNPRYDVEARPARALRKILDSRGDCR